MIWTEIPSGFNQPPEKSKVVVFHAILPTSIWEWDSESEVYIRFGHANLGNWQCDCGPMTLERYCFLKLDVTNVCGLFNKVHIASQNFVCKSRISTHN